MGERLLIAGDGKALIGKLPEGPAENFMEDGIYAIAFVRPILSLPASARRHVYGTGSLVQTQTT